MSAPLDHAALWAPPDHAANGARLCRVEDVEPRSLLMVDSIAYVELRDLPYGGPFWDHEGCIGDDWTLWESLGLSRETYEACMGWTGDTSEKARLLRRLRDELPQSITVEDSLG